MRQQKRNGRTGKSRDKDFYERGRYVALQS